MFSLSYATVKIARVTYHLEPHASGMIKVNMRLECGHFAPTLVNSLDELPRKGDTTFCRCCPSPK